jgi:hypothetical protein
MSNLILVVGMTIIARTGAPHQHRFITFEQSIADQTLDQAVNHLLTCREAYGASGTRDTKYSYYSQSQQCTYSPTTGTFSRIQFAISGDRIRGVSIHVRENTLTIGDLALAWGMPVRRVNGKLVYLMWPGRNVTAFSKTGRFSYLLPVFHIWLTEDCEGESLANIPYRHSCPTLW